MKSIKISFVLNIIIFVLVVFATISMLVGFKFMGEELVLTATKMEAFKFFTVDSNILMGITSLIFAILEYRIITKKEKKISSKLYTLKLVSTVGVMLTFLVTTCYLAPFLVDNFFILFKNSNLFFHFIIPVISLITFVFFEHADIKFKDTFWGVLPVSLYAIFYILNILTHIENGKVLPQYDWYFFAQGGLIQTIIVFIFMHIFTYLISLCLWFLNKKLRG